MSFHSVVSLFFGLPFFPLCPVLSCPSSLGPGVPGGLFFSKTNRMWQSRNMIFNVKTIISYLSQGTTLEAGTIILTGTPDGIGYARNPRVTLKDGSEIRIWIEKIGTLVNQVRFEGW